MHDALQKASDKMLIDSHSDTVEVDDVVRVASVVVPDVADPVDVSDAVVPVAVEVAVAELADDVDENVDVSEVTPAQIPHDLSHMRAAGHVAQHSASHRSCFKANAPMSMKSAHS